jgi:hypothetical protein
MLADHQHYFVSFISGFAGGFWRLSFSTLLERVQRKKNPFFGLLLARGMPQKQLR